MKRIILVLALTAVAFAVRAEEIKAVRILQVPMDEADAAFLAGVYSGIVWHNAARGANSPAFCTPFPLKVGIPVQAIVDMTKRFLAAHPTYTSAPMGLAVEKALEDAFPCIVSRP